MTAISHRISMHYFHHHMQHKAYAQIFVDENVMRSKCIEPKIAQAFNFVNGTTTHWKRYHVRFTAFQIVKA